VRLACVKRAASVDSEPGSNSRLNLLFWMARLSFAELPDRSPQFELKLLTKFLFLPLHNALQRCAMFRIQPDCQTSAHPIRDHCFTVARDLAKTDYMPASKAVRPQPKQPQAKIQPVTGRLNYNQKLGDLKELLQKGGYRDFSRKKLFTASFTVSCCLPYPKSALLAPSFENSASCALKSAKVPLRAYCHQLL
jgi:hypothetical protein